MLSIGAVMPWRPNSLALSLCALSLRKRLACRWLLSINESWYGMSGWSGKFGCLDLSRIFWRRYDPVGCLPCNNGKSVSRPVRWQSPDEEGFFQSLVPSSNNTARAQENTMPCEWSKKEVKATGGDWSRGHRDRCAYLWSFLPQSAEMGCGPSWPGKVEWWCKGWERGRWWRVIKRRRSSVQEGQTSWWWWFDHDARCCCRVLLGGEEEDGREKKEEEGRKWEPRRRERGNEKRPGECGRSTRVTRAQMRK